MKYLLVTTDPKTHRLRLAGTFDRKREAQAAAVEARAAGAPAEVQESRLAEHLRAAREASGLSQEAAARAVGAAGNTWARWEQGRHEPDLMTLRRVAAVLHVTLAALLSDLPAGE